MKIFLASIRFVPEMTEDGDCGFWISVATDIGFDPVVYNSDSCMNLDSLGRYFDSTYLGMLRVFHMFDKDNDSSISRSEAVRGARSRRGCEAREP